MEESEEELKSLLMKEKEESEKQHSKSKDHGIQSHHFMVNRWGNNGNSDRLYFLGAQNHCRHLLLRRKAMTNLDSVLKKQRHYCVDKGLYSESYGFSSSHVWM